MNIFRLKRQWRDISFCLAQLSYNEKTFTKLLENSNCYMEKVKLVVVVVVAVVVAAVAVVVVVIYLNQV